MCDVLNLQPFYLAWDGLAWGGLSFFISGVFCCRKYFLQKMRGKLVNLHGKILQVSLFTLSNGKGIGAIWKEQISFMVRCFA